MNSISKKPLESTIGLLETEHADLIVLSTEGREGLPRWLHPSFSEALLRRSRVATLFVPAGARGFVSHEDGAARLGHILVAADNKPHPDPGIDVASGLVKCLHVEQPAVEALFIGEPDQMPTVHPPHGFSWSFEQLARPGKPVEEILRRADEIEADLIVTVTEGHHGFLDALRGSTTEQIVRRASCPVLAVPAAGCRLPAERYAYWAAMSEHRSLSDLDACRGAKVSLFGDYPRTTEARL